jgi:leader peptidase (prepilin peptidase)/N-methyltransferase
MMPLPQIVRKHGLSVVTALLFLLAAWRLGMSAELPAVLAFIFGGVLLAVIDWKVQRLPTKIVYLTLAGVSAGLLFAAIVRSDWTSLLQAAAGAGLFASVYFVIWLFGERFLGFKLVGLGDVRLAMVLGALLGWYGLEYVLLGAIVGHLLALAVGLVKAARERKFHFQFAFGPPLIVATLAVVLIHG